MKNANISWYVKEQDNTYVSHTDYYAGTCMPNKDFIVDAEIWNNRWNISEDVSNMHNSKLVISFANIEDSILLSLCSVSINDGPYNATNTQELNRALVLLGSIYGTKNNGSESNTDNYKKISVKFSNIPDSFREGLKSMFLDIQFE